MACNIAKKHDINYTVVLLTLILLLQYLVNAEFVVWTFTTMNTSCCVPHAGWENHCDRKSLKICYFFNINQEQVYRIVPRSRTSTNWKDASTASGPLWVTRLLNVIMSSGISGYALVFVLERTFWAHAVIKIMWFDTCDFFWETITAFVCCLSVNHSNVHLIIAWTAKSDTLNFTR